MGTEREFGTSTALTKCGASRAKSCGSRGVRAAAGCGGAVEIPVLAERQSRLGKCAVRTVEREHPGERSFGGEAKNCTKIVAAAGAGRAIEIPVGPGRQSGLRLEAVERHQ